MTELFTPPIPERRISDRETYNFSDYIWFFKTLARNPLETYSTRSYEQPIVAGRSLGIDFATIHDPECVHQYLVKNAANYRFDRLRQIIFEPILREGLLVAEDELWRKTRKSITGVFTPRYVATLGGIMANVADKRVKDLMARNGSEIAMADEMVEAALDILIACMFAPETEIDRARFTHNLDLIFTNHSRPHILDFMNAPDWIPRPGHKRRAQIMADLHAQLLDILNAQRARFAGNETALADKNDLLSLLLRAGVKEGEPLTDDQIIDNLLTFLAAGHETSARTLGWAFYLIASSEYQDLIADELDSLDLSDLPEHKWQTALPVLTAALKETMRLYPAAGNISRMAVEADIIGDLEIKPGTAVSTAPWVLHRHQKIWENPDTFDPRRFMGTAADKIHRYAYLPFGAGPRVCVGASFAMQEMIIILAKYLKAFRFTHTGTEAPMPLMQITIQPTTPLMMGIEKR